MIDLWSYSVRASRAGERSGPGSALFHGKPILRGGIELSHSLTHFLHLLYMKTVHSCYSIFHFTDEETEALES